jgi:hypothetical protein
MTKLRRRLPLAGLALLIGLSAAVAQPVGPPAGPSWSGGPPPWAGRGEGHRRRHHRGDHDCAMRALADGRAKPLSELLPTIEKELGGQVIDVELEHCHGQIVYEVKVLRPDGRLVEAEVDALTGKRIEEAD